MRIGEASRLTGLPPKTIRYYERTGLIDPPPRQGTTYRDFGADDIARLRFLRRARDLGFSTAHMRELLSLWRNVNRESGAVKRLVLDHLANLEVDRRALETSIAMIQDLAARCEGDRAQGCSILDSLSSNSRLELIDTRGPSSSKRQRLLVHHRRPRSRRSEMAKADPT